MPLASVLARTGLLVRGKVDLAAWGQAAPWAQAWGRQAPWDQGKACRLAPWVQVDRTACEEVVACHSQAMA